MDGANASTNESQWAVVVTGGGPLVVPLPGWLAAIVDDEATVIVAADSGLDHALAAGLAPSVVVGDFDSASTAGLAWAETHGAEIVRHPAAKDSTDTELALATAMARGTTDVVLLGGGGDRLDHTIGALTSLGHASLRHLSSVRAVWGASEAYVLHGPRELLLDVAPGTTFSALALHGPCTGVFERGSRWPLENAAIEPGSSIGVSNLARTTPVRVGVATGVLTVIVPNSPELS